MALVFYPIFLIIFLVLFFFFPANSKEGSQVAAFAVGDTMGKEKIWIAAGADSRHGNVFLLDSCFQENNAVGFPEIQLILSIVFFVKRRFQYFSLKAF